MFAVYIISTVGRKVAVITGFLIHIQSRSRLFLIHVQSKTFLTNQKRLKIKHV